MGFELETLTALDLAGLLIDGNAQGRAGAIEALVEKSGECILCGIVLRPFHPLWHAWSSVEARGCHGWKRRKRRKHPWRGSMRCGAVFGGAICGCPAFFGRCAPSSRRPAANRSIVGPESTESTPHRRIDAGVMQTSSVNARKDRASERRIVGKHRRRRNVADQAIVRAILVEAMDLATVIVLEEPQEVAEESVDLDHRLVGKGWPGEMSRR